MHATNIVAALSLDEETRIMSKYNTSLTQNDILELTRTGADPRRKNGHLNDQIITYHFIRK